MDDFERDADQALTELQTSLDELSLDAPSVDMEVELQMGILSIELPDGAKYIINSHRAAKQIWMAAEREAWHFDRGADGKWTASKTGDELWSTIERVLSKKLARPIELPRKR